MSAAASTETKARPANAVRRQFTAIWYDPAKCEAKAIKAGWDKNSGDGFLDVYSPEEDPHGAEQKHFDNLRSTVSFLRDVIKKGGDFWGQAEIIESEFGGPRCRYCICRGNKNVRRYTVTEDGIESNDPIDDCAEGE
jgi:hypothetical protein